MKPIFEPSAQDFLDAQLSDLDFRGLFDHILDEVRQLFLDPTVDGQNKLVYPLPYAPNRSYRILWGQPYQGRSFWYIYDPDYEADLLRIYNIGHAGLEDPFLSRR